MTKEEFWMIARNWLAEFVAVALISAVSIGLFGAMLNWW